MENDLDEKTIDRLAVLGLEWKWILFTGVVYCILGIVAFSMPVVTTVGVTLGLATVLVIGGIVHLIHSVKLRRGRGTAVRIFQSILAILAGGLMFRYPGGGMLGIALVLSFYFFLGAAAQWFLAFAVRPEGERAWAVVSSIVSFLLGAFIVLTFPFSALWVPGALLGIDLIIGGATMIGISASVRSLKPEPEQGAESSTLQAG